MSIGFQNSSRALMIQGLVGLALIGVGAYLFVEWTVNRIYVPVGKSLVLTYKGPVLFGRRVEPAPGELARVDKNGQQQVGVLAEMKGPGRHFYSPLWWRTELVNDVVVKPGEVAIFTSLVGNPPAPGKEGAGQFLVDGNMDSTHQQGVLRNVYGPGRYRVNPYAYKWQIVQEKVDESSGQKKHSGWVSIPTGYVGVVTYQYDNPATKVHKGIQKDVLQPGIYPVNPYEQRIDIVEVGFREKSIVTNEQTDAQGNRMVDAVSGEPIMAADSGGISFPSKDGFTIHMDFTAVWGIMPEQAPKMIRVLGNVDNVEQRVVIPQIESICRNEGSELGATELLVGDSRLKFQDSVTKEFHDKLSNNDVTLLYGLVRYIYIPQEVRVPIQKAFIADELTLTREQEQITTSTESKLREAERKVELERERIKQETSKLVAQKQAEGAKLAAETKAETDKKVAEIDKQTAEMESQALLLKTTATTDSKKLEEEAKAEKFKLAVAAFGSGEAYNQWVFATGLPEDIQLNMLYAGEGTFWTDLKGFTETMLGKQVKETTAKPAKAGR